MRSLASLCQSPSLAESDVQLRARANEILRAVADLDAAYDQIMHHLVARDDYRARYAHHEERRHA